MVDTDLPFFVDREPDVFDEEARDSQNGESDGDGLGESDGDGLGESDGDKLGEIHASETPKPPPGRKAKALWIDEDDEHLSVNLLQVPRRKKLRKNIAEKRISAAEYSRRVQNLQEERRAESTGTGQWARLPSEKRGSGTEKNSDGENEVDEESASDTENDLSNNVKNLLRSTGRLLAKRKRSGLSSAKVIGATVLPTKVLNLRVLPNANREDPCRAEARCVQFHPSGRLLLTAGLDKTLRIFQVDGGQNSKVQGIHMKNFPIHGAKFTGGGAQVVLTSRRKFFYEFDMESAKFSRVETLLTHEDRSWEKFEVSGDGSKLAFVGNQGRVIIAANKSKREIGQLRHKGHVACVAFGTSEEQEHYIYSSTDDGTVHLWDVRKMSCVDKHKDEGGVHSTSLAVSKHHYAIGSDCGIVNLYDKSAIGHGAEQNSVFGARIEKPIKVFENLTTDIDHVGFNSDGQLLTFASHVKKEAVRIAHVGNKSVFTNWPTSRSIVRRVCSLAFSPGSGYLAVGNDKGDVQLLRLKAYAAR